MLIVLRIKYGQTKRETGIRGLLTSAGLETEEIKEYFADMTGKDTNLKGLTQLISIQL